MYNDKVVIGGEISLKNTIDGDGDLVFVNRINGDHNLLTNRDLDDQHPISAITGLADELAARPILADLSIIYCGTSTEVI